MLMMMFTCLYINEIDLSILISVKLKKKHGSQFFKGMNEMISLTYVIYFAI